MQQLKKICLFVFFCSGMVVIAQNQDYLRGRVLDKETGEPLVFATIRIKDKPIGVITNMDGGFRIPLQFREEGDTLQISSLGYKNVDFPLLRLSPTDINIIRLETGVLLLDEAVVSAKKKRKLYTQYREFFTQEITQVGDLMVEKDLMIKTLPLDSPSQLISKGDMKNDYWMNTPLPGLEP